MKRIKFTVLVIAIVLLSSCVVTPRLELVFDETLPVEESAWVSPVAMGTITSYNGISVNWVGRDMTMNVFQIPAGDTILEWRLSAHYYSGSGILFQYNFLAGKQYYFYADNVDDRYGFWVFESDIGKKVSPLYNTNKSEGFFPFLNTNERTILN